MNRAADSDPFKSMRLLFLRMIQTININITEATKVVKSKEALGGFIFAYMIKTTFVSGRINNANTRRICHALGVGNTIVGAGLKARYGGRQHQTLNGKNADARNGEKQATNKETEYRTDRY